MTTLKVAVPVLKGSHKFFYLKGRFWSVVEHVVLAAIVKRAQSVENLSNSSTLPPRMVLESLVRLMKAGWVELAHEGGAAIFTSTKAGRDVVGDDELTPQTKTRSKRISFVIDQITGTVYRQREMPSLETRYLEDKEKIERIVRLKSPYPFDMPGSSDFLTLFDEDERFLSVVDIGERLVERWNLVTIRNGMVEGLSQRAPEKLKAEIYQAIKLLDNANVSNLPLTYAVEPASLDAVEPSPIPIKFQHEDLILGAEAHKDAFKRALTRARSRLIIHSTFIRREQLDEFWPALCDLARSGIVVDILWGAGEAKKENSDTADAVSHFIRKATQAGVEGNLRIHAHSTESHAKFLVYDDKSGNRVFAIVGSCNWLSTNFSSYETSVRFGDPAAVSEILTVLADLTMAPNGGWYQITNDIAALASATATHKPYSGVNAQFALVLGPSHGNLMRLARDRAAREITVISHRVSEVARTAVLAPLGARSNGVTARVLFNQEGVGTTSTETAALIRDAQKIGVLVKPTGQDSMHGKLLAWDDDNIVVTSQNWLSRDAGARDSKSEIGIWLESKGLAVAAVSDIRAKFAI